MKIAKMARKQHRRRYRGNIPGPHTDPSIKTLAGWTHSPGPIKGKEPPAEDPQGSSGEESMPELIDLGKGEETLIPS